VSGNAVQGVCILVVNGSNYRSTSFRDDLGGDARCTLLRAEAGPFEPKGFKKIFRCEFIDSKSRDFLKDECEGHEPQVRIHDFVIRGGSRVSCKYGTPDVRGAGCRLPELYVRGQARSVGQELTDCDGILAPSFELRKYRCNTLS